MIIRSGFNVYPAEVEAAISRHPAALRSAFVSAALADGNEEVVAFVQTREGAQSTDAGLAEFLRGQISPHKRPNRIYPRPAFPVGPTGKIHKRRLVAELRAETT